MVALIGALYAPVAWLTRRTAKTRVMFAVSGLALALAAVAYNGWLLARGVDPADHTIGLLTTVGKDFWIQFAIVLAKLAAAAVAVLIGSRILRAALNELEARLNRWDSVRENDRSIGILFAGISRAILITGWMLVAALGVWLLAAPDAVVHLLLRGIRAYVVIAVGLLFIRGSAVIVATLEALTRRHTHTRGWTHYYEHLRPLVPTFRACLEYALWIALVSLAAWQVGLHAVAAWGPSVIQAIGIFFVACVVIELGRLEIGRRLLPQEGLDEMTRRRRETIAPLLRNAFAYAVYFAAVVLILASLGFNPVPFLAGAGILGLVIGFGAQSLINDVVSGFFILFENTYLVGDSIEVVRAKGVVEAIDFRTTKIRDADGRVHIIRNGDVKEVINYSKDYTLAVVPVDVSYDADLRAVFSVLAEAGERLRAESDNVTGETQIDGIVAFGAAAMTIRTTTRVKAGRHEAAAAELRLAIKEAFDRRVDGSGRRGLVPAGLSTRAVVAH